MPEPAESPSEGMVRAYLGLGSNVGDRLGHLRFAVRRLRRHDEARLLSVSPIYETAAHTVGGAAPPYLNAVVEIETRLGPRELLALCLRIERARGRERTVTERWAPRTLDIDLLVFGEVSLREPGLTLPHPHLAERLFVLRPLFDVAPDIHVSAPFDASVRELLAACEDAGAVRRMPYPLAAEDDDARDA